MHRLSHRIVQTAVRRARAPAQWPPVTPGWRSGPSAAYLRRSTNSAKSATTASTPATPAPPNAASSQNTIAAAEAATAKPTAPAANAAPAAAAGKEGAPTIPDINSTTLGIEHIPDPHTNDPLKWRKFLWKYAGAVAVFLVAYKAVHYYVDGLQEDGQRRRDEVEENKELRKQFDADQEKAHRMLATAHSPAAAMGQMAPGAMPGAAPGSGDAEPGAMGAPMPAAGAEGEQPPPMALFKPIQEEEGFVSELDELRTLQVELMAKHKALGKERRQTDEVKSKMWGIEGELKDLDREIEELERVEAKRKAA